MAVIRTKGKSRKSVLLAGVSGQIGKIFVVKQYKDKIVLANYPSRSRKKPTQAQKDKRDLFADAVSYARAIIKDPAKKAAYSRKFKGRNVYHAAIAEFLKGRVAFGSF